jgi:type I restriction enzyme, S subunit
MSEIRKYNLSEVADLVTGSTPRTDNEKFWNGSIPFYSPADFNGSIFCEHTEKTVSEMGAKSGRLIPQGAIMVTCIGTIGKIAISSTDGITNQQINTLLVKTGFDARYVYYVVLNNTNKLKQAAPQTTIPILNKTDFGKFRFDFHEYPQQIKVAEILSTIDRTITHTEALIEKYQQIKAGLMHDLFTRGIGADGKLRPTRDEAPELYQESSIGWIPKEWKLSVLREYLIDNPTNGIYKSPDQIGDGTLMIGQTAFTKDRSIDFNLCRRGLISEAEERKYNVSENNILITRVFATVDGVGLPTLVPQIYEKAVFESNMMRLRIDDSKIAPLILFEWLRGSKVRKLIVSGANASNQVSVNQKTLNILPVPLIGGDEQSRIVDSISIHNRRYLIEKMYLDKLKKQKSGLMHDLLTGTVQVNSDSV